MVENYKFELSENGKLIRSYQDENIEEIFNILVEEFEGLQDIKEEFTEKLLNRFFSTEELEEFKKEVGRYEDIFYCIQDYLSTEEYKEIFNKYFNSLDKTTLKYKITEF